jgi:membrane protein
VDNSYRARARRLWQRIRVFLTRDLWSLEAGGLPTFRQLLVWISRVLYIAIRGFRRDRCMFHAAALTYITVLSIVPVLAFAFSVAKGLGAYDRLVDSVITPTLDEIFPTAVGATTDSAQGVRRAIEYSLEIVDKTDVSNLGLFGLAILVWAVVKMLGAMERSFNEIWDVKASRSWVRKLTDYLAIVVITPIFLMTAGAFVGALGFDRARSVVEEWHMGPAFDLLLRLVPLLVAWVAFTFLNLCLPNRRMGFSSAVVGGIGGGTLWLALQVLFLQLQIWTANFNKLYAGFAVLPIFLVWIYLSWATVLFGAELAAAHQRAPTYRGSAYVGPVHKAFEEVVALRALTWVARSFLEGRQPWTIPALSERMRVPELWIDDVVDTLVAAGILAFANGDRGQALLPARALDSIRVCDVRDALSGSRMTENFPARDAASGRVERVLAQLDGVAADSAHNHTLRELGEEAVRDAAELGGEPQRAAPETT